MSDLTPGTLMRRQAGRIGWLVTIAFLVAAIAGYHPIRFAPDRPAAAGAGRVTSSLPRCGPDCDDPPVACVAGAEILNGSSGGSWGTPQIACRPLVLARLAAMPTGPASFEIRRAGFPVAAATPIDRTLGPTILYVERGTLGVEIEPSATGVELVRRLPQVATPTAPAPMSPGWESLALGRWDELIIPTGIAYRAFATGDKPADALMVRVVPATIGETPSPGITTDKVVVWQSVASALVESLPPAPAVMAMALMIYEPGAADPELTENLGPLLTYVEVGQFGYFVAAGASVLIRAGAETGDVIPVATESILESGDQVIEQANVVSGLRNVGPERAIALMAMIVPLPESSQTNSGSPKYLVSQRITAAKVTR